jgi:plastocyanin
MHKSMNTNVRRLASAIVPFLLLLAGALGAQEPADSADRADSVREDSLWHARLRGVRGIPADTAKPPRPDTAARAGASARTPRPANDASVPGPNQVFIYQFVFNPKVITVPAGTTISWINHDVAAHTATRNGGADQFDSGDLRLNREFTHTFDTPGRYDYICFYHPGMKGTVVVTPTHSTSEPGASTAGGQRDSTPRAP